MPGVVKVVTGKGCKFRYGDNIRDLHPMAIDKVHYIGEPVAAVIADTPMQAQAALAPSKWITNRCLSRSTRATR